MDLIKKHRDSIKFQLELKRAQIAGSINLGAKKGKKREGSGSREAHIAHNRYWRTRKKELITSSVNYELPNQPKPNQPKKKEEDENISHEGQISNRIIKQRNNSTLSDIIAKARSKIFIKKKAIKDYRDEQEKIKEELPLLDTKKSIADIAVRAMQQKRKNASKNANIQSTKNANSLMDIIRQHPKLKRREEMGGTRKEREARGQGHFFR